MHSLLNDKFAHRFYIHFPYFTLHFTKNHQYFFQTICIFHHNFHPISHTTYICIHIFHHTYHRISLHLSHTTYILYIEFPHISPPFPTSHHIYPTRPNGLHLPTPTDVAISRKRAHINRNKIGLSAKRTNESCSFHQ